MNSVIPSFNASLFAPGAAAATSQVNGRGTNPPHLLTGDSATCRALSQAQSSLALASLQGSEAARVAAADVAAYKQAAARYQYAIEFAGATRRKALAAQAIYEQTSEQERQQVNEQTNEQPGKRIGGQTGALPRDAQPTFSACKQAWQTAGYAASDAQTAYRHYRAAFVQATVTTSASRRADAAETAAVAACNHALAADDASAPLRHFAQLPHSLGPRVSGYPALESEVARSQAFRRSLSSRLSAAG